MIYKVGVAVQLVRGLYWPLPQCISVDIYGLDRRGLGWSGTASDEAAAPVFVLSITTMTIPPWLNLLKI